MNNLKILHIKKNSFIKNRLNLNHNYHLILNKHYTNNNNNFNNTNFIQIKFNKLINSNLSFNNLKFNRVTKINNLNKC